LIAYIAGPNDFLEISLGLVINYAVQHCWFAAAEIPEELIKLTAMALLASSVLTVRLRNIALRMLTRAHLRPGRAHAVFAQASLPSPT
jgi:hypothetical protein